MSFGKQKDEILDALVSMSLRLGANTDFVILGEGNTSARCSDNSFYVKASGSRLGSINNEGFVEVFFKPTLELLDSRQEGDEIVSTVFKEAKVNPNTAARPSVETLFHAFLLTLPDVNFVGHIHPVAVNSILCSVRSREIVSGRLFPEESVVCGPEPVYIPFCDPGLMLARRMKRGVLAYQEKWGTAPRALLMENHGLVALGANPQEVEAICMMWEKTARILLGTLAAGGPRYMTHQQVDRIQCRPDEIARRKQISGE